MPTRDSYEPGTPCWADHASADADAAAAFYCDIFGWTSPPGSPDFGGYRMFEQDGHQVAGAGTSMDPTYPTTWTTYVATADADATAQAVRDAGGQVVFEPMDVGPAGRMAICIDPAGAPFGLWQAGEHIGATLVNEPVSLTWTHLASPDPEACARFYGAVFGWEGSPSGAGTTQFTLPGGDGPIAGMSQSDGDAAWSVLFAVPDADALAASIGDRGGQVVRPVEPTPWGRIGALADPQGAHFGVVTIAA